MSDSYSQAPTAGGMPGRVAIHGAGNPHDGHSHPHHPKLQHHFDDMAQQAEASTLGMWVFLVTEIMFFGGLFMAYLLYRWQSPEGLRRGQQPPERHLGRGQHRRADRQLADDGDGGACGADRARRPRSRSAGWSATMILGAAFLGVKAIEYADKFEHHLVPGPHFHVDRHVPRRRPSMFYSIYFCMTGLHALHMIIGIGIML